MKWALKEINVMKIVEYIIAYNENSRESLENVCFIKRCRHSNI